ncbi:MAG: hypothetical protein CBB92_03240 [Flammeovirgaceae bacterium TMED32]|nr:MAG: hypothetical protein CBB92_03240 [Flammeovirgaceae bacterium TMED32]
MKTSSNDEESMAEAGLVIVGAGGHGKVVADCARLMDAWSSIRFADDKYPEISQVNGITVIGNGDPLTWQRNGTEHSDVFVAVGHSETRYRLMSTLIAHGHAVVTVVSPNTNVSDSVQIGMGSLVVTGAIINAGAVIGEGVIVNTGAIVEHDCSIGNFTHICPRAMIAGDVVIGVHTWIGIGSTVIEGRKIGDNVMVAAGSVVVSDVPSGSRVKGVPARQF